MHEQALAVGRVLGTHLGNQLGVTRVDVAIDRVVDDFDVILDVEDAQSSIAKIVRDGGDAVTLFDGVTRDRKVRAIEADEGDVGAMERGHEGQAAAAWSNGHHLPGEQSTHGMRNRVVNVEKIKIVKLRDLGHTGGEREIVRRVVEERITSDFDFVIMDVVLRAAQANGLSVGDEVNFVAALRQFQAEFGGDDAAAAVGGISGNSNLHEECRSGAR